MISPLAADLFYLVSKLERESDGGPVASFAQCYGLFTCAMAAGALVGPVLAGAVKDRFGWTVMAWILGAFSVSGAIPVVSVQQSNHEFVPIL